MSALPMAHDRLILDSLFRQHNGWLTKWLRTQRWTVVPAEDIASDVFLALLQMPAVGAVREPRAMMTTIARRLIYEARRRDTLRSLYQAELMALPEVAEISPEERIIVLQALEAIDLILAGLSLKARTAFLMSQVDGRKYAEIADEMKISSSMVRKYVAQGMRAVYSIGGQLP